MCNRFIERFVNKVIEKNKVWLWIYSDYTDSNQDVNFLLIYADTRRDAIIKLINNPKYIRSVFHTDIATYVNNNNHI